MSKIWVCNLTEGVFRLSWIQEQYEHLSNQMVFRLRLVSTGIVALKLVPVRPQHSSINDGIFIQSGPVALWGFRSFSNLNTPFVLITMSFMDGYLLCPLSGIVLVFSFVYTDWNCSLSISALDVVSLCIKPSLLFQRCHSCLFLLFTLNRCPETFGIFL